MSDKANRNVRVEFGILNIGGFMQGELSEDGRYFETLNPVFNTDSYKIKTTFNRNIKYIHNGEEKITSSFGNVEFEDASKGDKIYYQKYFRRDVLWNFGDGTTKEGCNVEHTYKRPGRYKISCTFFDINREGWTNTYSIIVQVKEIIPTMIRFVEDFNEFKHEIKCSKIEKIAKIETLLAKDIEELKLVPKRIFSQEDYKKGDVEKSYNDVKNNVLYHMTPYFTFLENEVSYFNNSSVSHSSYMKPVEKYTPIYYEIYGKIQYDDATKKLVYRLYIYNPFKIKDKSFKTIKCLDPNCNVLDKEEYIDVDVSQIYSLDELSNESLIGKRGFVEVYYKNDNISSKDKEIFLADNDITFFYDIEHHNIFNDLKSSDNYLNIMPLGMSISIIPNAITDVKIALSSNGFLRNVDVKENYHLDEFFYNSFVKNYKTHGYFMPYILYPTENNDVILEDTDILLFSENIADFNTSKLTYYVPKDIVLTLTDILTEGFRKNEYQSSFKLLNETNDNTFIKGEFTFRDYIDHIYLFKIKNITNDSLYEDYSFNFKKTNLVDIDKLIIPTEKYTKIDVDKLIDVYLGHPMFDEAIKLKSGLKSLLKSQNFLSYILTKSDNFLNDRANISTCYLSNLLSMLKMMGEEITDYETSEFEGINDMRDFVRILSMNHSDLIGHLVNKPLDIRANDFYKGINVGKEMALNDKLIISTYESNLGIDGRGLIMGYEKYDKDTKSYLKYRDCYENIYGTHLILKDNYTKETRIVSFTTIPSLNKILKTDSEGRKYITLKDYDPSWGWNLLLTDRFKKLREDLNKKELSFTRRKYLENACADIIEGYYTFYLFYPKYETERFGNFLDSTTITPDIENVEKWNEDWGCVNDILLKIIIDNAKLKENIEPIIEEEEEKKDNTFVETISFEDERVTTKLTFGGYDEHTLYLQKDASITFETKMDGVENEMYISIADIIVRDTGLDFFENRYTFKNSSSIVEYLFVDENNNLYLYNPVIPLYLNNDEETNASLGISVSGTIENPKINIELNIDVPL